MGAKAPPMIETDVEFARPQGKVYIDKIEDPSHKPLDVIDADLGLNIYGHVELPGWLSGRGVISLYADELGGPIDTTIGSTTVPIAGGATPDPQVYSWTLNVLPVPLDEDKLYKFGLVFVFQTPTGGHTEIGAFFDLGVYMVV